MLPSAKTWRSLKIRETGKRSWYVSSPPRMSFETSSERMRTFLEVRSGWLPCLTPQGRRVFKSRRFGNITMLQLTSSPDMYTTKEGYSFEQWLDYLKRALLIRDSVKGFAITRFGHEFLLHLARSPKPVFKPF